MGAETAAWWTTGAYALLVVLWAFILLFYLRRLCNPRLSTGLLSTLLLVLALDAFRTLFESAYFGIWYAGVSGFLPVEFRDFLEQPTIVLLPKTFNIVVALLIITLLLYRWLPAERAQLAAHQQRERDLEDQLTTHRSQLDDAEKQLQREVKQKRLAEKDRARVLAAMDQAQEVVLITDRKGHIQYVNAAFEHLTDYDRNEAIGRHPRTYLPPEASGLDDRVWDGLRRRKTWKGRAAIQCKDGSQRQVDATVSPITNSSGRVANFLVMLRDVTREIQLEEQLQQSQRMEALASLAGGIAHDFNNILAAIIGYTELAMQEGADNAHLQEDLAQVMQGSQRAKELVHQILAFSRQQEEAPRPVRIDLVVHEALKLLGPSLPANIEVLEHIEAGHGTVMIDPTRAHQVLMNLCTNAYHAMRDSGGLLKISLERVDLDDSFRKVSQDLSAGPYLRLSIADTGCGMDSGTREKIFDPFFTTKSRKEGTGLGLSTVHGIVTSCGGAITVYSEPGQGSTFNVYFPLMDTAENELQLDDAPLPRGAGQCILVTDDEPAILELECEILSRLGYQVEARASAVDTLAAFRQNPDKFDLIITDQTMPHMTGLNLALEFRSLRAGIPVILTTGFSNEGIEEKARVLGVAGVVRKPFVIRQFAEAIASALTGDPEPPTGKG